uniref:Si:dkey-89b17.4 n=1 Tax=Takifugu rubripes TaxID=31033 RepID=A0A674P580_TAKRU
MAMHDMSRAKGFPCKECDMVCPSTPSLLEHMKAHYQQEDSGRFECEQCGRIYKHAASLANHKKSHEVGSFQCPVCTRTLPNSVALKNHLRIHTLSPSSAHTEEENEEVPDESGQDEREYSLAQDLSDGFGRSHLNHSGMGHSVLQSHNTDDQGKKSSSESDDAWDRPFKCDQCDRTYRHHGSLVNHKKCHQQGTFKCSVCFKQFSNLAALNSHERTHSKFKSPGSSLVSSSSSTQSSQGQDAASCFCHLCQVALPNKADFQEHILLHNSSSPSLGLSRSFPGIMPHNLSAVRSPAYTPALGDPLPLPPLPSDKRGPYDPIMGPPVNNPIYTCAYCGAGHPDLETLKVHYLTHDPHPASHGQDASILNSNTLRSGSQGSVSSPAGGRVPQANSPDDGERRFKCGECGKSYRHAGSLVNHKRCHQTGHYQCTICCKQYPHLAALHSHLRSHKGRSSNQHLGGDGNDWLSSEPLTLDSQQSYVQEGSGAATPISLPGNLGDAAHFVSDGGHSSGLDSLEFHDRFDGSALSQSNAAHRQPQQQQGNISNGFMGNLNYHSSGGSSLPSGSSGALKEGSSQRQYSQSGGKRMGNNEKDEDDGEVYQCSVCGNHYASLRALRSHLRSHANNPTGPGPSNMEQDWRMICATCGQSFSRKQDLLNHQLVHGPQRPDGQQQGVGNASANGTDKMDGTQPHLCGLWHVFADRHHLITHLCPGKNRASSLNKQGLNGAKGMSGGDGGGGSRGGGEGRQPMVDQSDKPHKCDQCGRGYRHPCSLLNHKKSHKTGVFRCLVCQKRYYNLLALKNHQRTHFDLKRHKCEECGKAFKIQKQLINHLRLHEEQRAKGLVRVAPVRPRFPAAGPLPAADHEGGVLQGPGHGHEVHPPGLQKPYSSAGTSRPQKFDPAESGRRLFPVKNVGKRTDTQAAWPITRTSHKIGEYHCNVCNSTYPNRLHNCQECGKGFRTQRQLATHTTAGLCKGICLLHPPPTAPPTSAWRGARWTWTLTRGPTPATCAAAPTSTPAPCSTTSTPTRRATSGCNFCNKPYTNYMALRNHMRIHTQRKKHICHTCGKAFRLARFLRNHQKVTRRRHPLRLPHLRQEFPGEVRSGQAPLWGETREKSAGTREYMISNPASLGPYACRNSDFSEVWTN